MKIRMPRAVTRAAARTALKTRKNAPHILFGAGIVGFGATVFLGAKATLQLEQILDNGQERHDIVDATDPKKLEPNTKEQAHRYVTAGVAKDLVVLYAPTVVVGAASIACLTKSHVILTRRNAALSAAYAGVLEAFNRYRERVRNELGEAKDLEFLHGKHDAVEEYEDRNGPKKRKTKKAGDDKSDYKLLFGRDTSRNWSPEHDYNIVTLRAVQRHANDKLQARGHLYLNEVLEALGMEHTTAGAVTGWMRETKTGDGYVSLGIFEDNTCEAIHDFLVGVEGEVWLNFNVDGEIYRLMGRG